VLGFASSGLPGPKGNLETFCRLAEGGRAGRAGRSRGRGAGGRSVVSRSASVFTHRTAEETSCALEPLISAAVGAGFELRFDATETRKHGLTPREGLLLDADPDQATEVCVVLGGDGTILTALRRYAGTDVPVFAVNFGEVGFLATIERGVMEREFARAFAGEFEVLRLPAVVLEGPDGEHVALNDVSIHRKVGERVATLAYALESRRSDRCAATGSSSPRPRVDGLQPRQRRAGPGLGRRGLRRLVHRAALADRSGDRRRAQRRADRRNRSKGRRRRDHRRRPIGELQPDQGVDARFGRRSDRLPRRGSRSTGGCAEVRKALQLAAVARCAPNECLSTRTCVLSGAVLLRACSTSCESRTSC
jgi:hypothetical protein